MFLEYRLLDEEETFPLLSHYANISKEEIMLRFQCDYWVKGKHVYELMSTASEPDGYVIYVKVDPEKSCFNPEYVFERDWIGVKVEFRHFQESKKEHPLIKVYTYQDPRDALLHLASDFYEINGVEWLKEAATVDENMKKYVYYAKPTN
jgi:hypothetical protein